ncbi:DUF2975 domain-containing protein [Agromyces italicus]|uniref:DUF2975 domain-containing protein n=1 Tax=Agromyces italicus TaxID=279572 RepID=UPI0003B34B19|nr:DUF2975 domain-containing protein [Agromyces italicus]
MQRPTLIVLKVLIVVMLLLLLSCQLFLVPGTARTLAASYPELAGLQVPGIVIAVLFLVCVEVVMVCVWRLLSMVGEQNIFSSDAFRWVDLILASIIAATLLIAVAGVVLFSAGVANPSVQLLCALGIVVGTGLALLVGVMRGLLKNAAQLQHDLSEVV